MATSESNQHISAFAALFAKPDGRFIMATLEENTSPYVVACAIKACWKMYVEEKVGNEIEGAGGQKREVRNLYPNVATAEGETVPLQQKSIL